MFSTSRASSAVIKWYWPVRFNTEHRAFLNDYYNNSLTLKGLLYCFKHLLCAALEGECCYLFTDVETVQNGLRIQAPVISGFTACTTNSYTLG